jgi:flagellar biosynthesis protein FlhG
MQPNSMPMTIGISSGKGGVGKTTLTVNLAYALMDRGLRVLIVDGDLGLANVDLLLGLSVKKDIRNVVQSGGAPADGLCFPEERLAVLPATSGVPEMVRLSPDERQTLENYLTGLFGRFDCVLVDTAAGIGDSVIWLNNFVQHNILIMTPDPTAMTDAYALMKVLSQKHGRKRFLVVLNAVSGEPEAVDIYEKLKTVAMRFLKLDGLTYVGAMETDAVVRQSIRRQAPFYRHAPKSPSARAVARIADRLMTLCKAPAGAGTATSA